MPKRKVLIYSNLSVVCFSISGVGRNMYNDASCFSLFLTGETGLSPKKRCNGSTCSCEQEHASHPAARNKKKKADLQSALQVDGMRSICCTAIKTVNFVHHEQVPTLSREELVRV